MKKLMYGAALIAFSLDVLNCEAMIINVVGVDKFPKNTQFKVEYTIFEDNHPNEYCGSFTQGSSVIQSGNVNEFLQKKLIQYRPEKCEANSPPIDSTLTIQAIGAEQICHNILSNMALLSIQLHADGTCTASGQDAIN